MNRKRVSKRDPGHSAFDAYDYYHRAVQSPETDVLFFRRVYRELREGLNPTSLREDFCGTFLNCCEWVKLHKENRAWGVDLDPAPLDYGKDHHLSQLSESQRHRVRVLEENVLDTTAPRTDLIVAMNFSYFIFKERQQLKSYMKSCFKSLKNKGVFVLDCFGGSACQDSNEDVTRNPGFVYFWEQESFDPLTHRAKFHIHFHLNHEKRKRSFVFTYDWRMWTLPELKDLLLEVGFKTVHFYWEGTSRQGRGNGVFRRVQKGEPCEAWIAYVVAGR